MAYRHAVLERRKKPIFAKRDRAWRREIAPATVAQGLLLLGAINVGAALLLYLN
jgi:hypothetical protein